MRRCNHDTFQAVSGVPVISAGMPVIDPYRPRALQNTGGRLHVLRQSPRKGRGKPVNRASRSNCRPIQRILTMTMYTVPPNATVAPAIRRRACFLLKRMGRLLNHWLSAVIAERARQADNIVLRHLSDRELKDIGLTRGDFGEGLAEADRSRIRMQRSKRSKRS